MADRCKDIHLMIGLDCRASGTHSAGDLTGNCGIARQLTHLPASRLRFQTSKSGSNRLPGFEVAQVVLKRHT